MQIEKERKFFQTALWIFIAATLIFYITYISAGRISLGPAAWLMLLLLVSGFIVFMFIPFPGKKAGRPGGGSEGDRWYPRTLADIVEKRGAQASGGALAAPADAIPPVPLASVLLLLALVLLSAPGEQDTAKWQKKESSRLTEVYGKAGKAMEKVDAASRMAAQKAALIIGSDEGSDLTSNRRAELIYSLDSLATASAKGIEPFEEIGIQVFSARGERLVWGGKPRYLGPVDLNTKETSVFSSRTQLYTLLVCEMPAEGGKKIIVDIPLEVNYKISNRFLRSTGLGDVMTEKYSDEVDYKFWMGTYNRGMRWNSSMLGDEGPEVRFEDGGRVSVIGLARSSSGVILSQIIVSSETYSSAMAERESRRALWGGLLLVLNILILSRWIYRRFAKRRSKRWGNLFQFARRTLMLVLFLALLRFILLRLDIPNSFFGTNLFDPALFADDIPGGLMRTSGDMLITYMFLLILVFGVIKAFRTYYAGYLEKPVSGWKIFNPARTILKAALMLGAAAGAARLSAGIVSRIIINSNPRLIGLDAEFFRLPVLSIHLSMLFAVMTVFLVAILILRIAFVTGGGSAAEGTVAAVIAVAATLAWLRPQWSIAAGLIIVIVLSARIFPVIRKEEALSIIATSLFLVLVCSMVIYGAGSRKYEELRKGRVLEKLRGFNYPEDNWLVVVLPDISERISGNHSAVSKVLSRNKSAAFEIWAESELSRLNLSCVFEVFDQNGKRFSRFSVGVPFEVLQALPEVPPDSRLPQVVRISRNTKDGKVYLLVAVSPVYHLNGKRAGTVEIVVPYFFDNPELLVQAGPMAPEIFQNVQIGSLAPRIDEPEDLLVAAVSGRKVLSSSSSAIAAGTSVPDTTGSWFVIDSEEGKYNCVTGYSGSEKGFIVGYRLADITQKVLQWSLLVSLDIILALFSFLMLIIVRRLPVLGSVTPALVLKSGLSFRRKLLLSFIAVSVLPVLMMGVFSGRYIKYRFDADGDRESRAAAVSAEALFDHSIIEAAGAFARSGYLESYCRGESVSRVEAPQGVRFALFKADGSPVEGRAGNSDDHPSASYIKGESEAGRVRLEYDRPYIYAAAVVPAVLPGGEEGFIYYKKRIDDDFTAGLAGVLGTNINIYNGGTLAASSERELFAGGFLNPLLDPAVFAEMALGRSSMILRDQNLGDYSYKVASFPVPMAAGGDRGVVSVPLLYRTALVRKETLRTYALIMGLLALLFCSAVTLGVFLAGKIITPITALRGGTQRIIEGDLEFRLEAGAHDEIGDLVYSFNTMTEALKMARKDLLERQRYLSAVLDNVATGVVSTGSDGSIVKVNPSGERILGTASKELVGVVPDRERFPELWPLFSLMSEAESGIVEKEVVLFEGDGKRTLKTVVTSLSKEGERLGAVIVFDDLTELIRTKKLSAWVEMARQIAHEVKNPLTPIKLSAQLMQRAYDEDSEEFKEIFTEGVQTVIQQTEILRRIASEFSSFGKAADIRTEELDARTFLSEILSGYRGADDIRISLAEGGDMRIRADREALRKIVVNLVENAIDAIQGEGSIDVEYRKAGGSAEIVVTDTGSGLSPEIQGRLFEPYFSTKTNGTGLGLAICQNLAREMDGEVILRNRAGARGVEAIVRVPLTESDGESGS